MFFFEKKDQKNFATGGRNLAELPGSDPGPQAQKFFGSFFQKRTSSFPRARRNWTLLGSAGLHLLLLLALLLPSLVQLPRPPPEQPGFDMVWQQGQQRPDAVPLPGKVAQIAQGESAQALTPAPPHRPPAQPKTAQPQPQPDQAPPLARPAPPSAVGSLPPSGKGQRHRAPPHANPFAQATEMDFSDHPHQAAGGRLRGSRSLDLSMGLFIRGGQLRDAVAHIGSPGAHGDYIERLTEYIEQHKFYPERALANGEDGVAIVHAVIARDGTVKDVQLAQSSGSRDLDSAWLSLFRGKRLAPFPDEMTAPEEAFDLSMNYILVRH